MTIDLDALEKLAESLATLDSEERDWPLVKIHGRMFHVENAAKAASDGLTALIAELKALQAFAADEIALAFSSGFNDAIGREKWDDCYDFAAVKSVDYRNDRIRAFLARNGKGEG